MQVHVRTLPHVAGQCAADQIRIAIFYQRHDLQGDHAGKLRIGKNLKRRLFVERWRGLST